MSVTVATYDLSPSPCAGCEALPSEAAAVAVAETMAAEYDGDWVVGSHEAVVRAAEGGFKIERHWHVRAAR